MKVKFSFHFLSNPIIPHKIVNENAPTYKTDILSSFFSSSGFSVKRLSWIRYCYNNSNICWRIADVLWHLLGPNSPYKKSNVGMCEISGDSRLSVFRWCDMIRTVLGGSEPAMTRISHAAKYWVISFDSRNFIVFLPG